MAIDTPATKDALTWHFTYRDDTQVPEFDDERPDGRSMADVDKFQVKALDLDAADMLGKHRVQIPEGAEPVFLRRRRIELNPNTDEQVKTTIHCIGWKQGDIGCYLFIFSDGSTLLTTNFNAV